MNFFKDIIELNNEIELKKKAETLYPTDDEEAMINREDFISKFNKRNNRLFKPTKKCYLHVYEQRLSRYRDRCVKNDKK